MSFLFWGLRSTLVRHLWGAAAAGFIFDLYLPVPIGFHILFFLSLAILMYLGKRFFRSHYFWGDYILVSGGSFVAGILFYIFSYVILGRRHLTFQYLASEGFLFLIISILMYFIIRWRFLHQSAEGESHVI
ncbi:MAG: hypothetical protein HY220_04015 [Candidatus Sungbacteria bacterium]|uniref:Rod shape-determining protein MreD n=1 Tax=Candidatus Sungiibacteriota bacterium TaxID=2750080 RepID=A0A9D6LUE5_9BACT|nr:hypothetical protein [Candidatus Sungbacteria bacterium]